MLIEVLKKTDFDIVYTIMEKSFPEDERRTYDEQKELLNNSAYKIYVYRESITNQIQAFAAIYELDEIVFIEHLAVNPDCRNGGIGLKFLKTLFSMTNKMICLEVELPSNEIAARRIGFYERTNFFLNEFRYIQPSLSKGRKEVPLYIMTSGRCVTKEEFEGIKNVLYEKVYMLPTQR